LNTADAGDLPTFRDLAYHRAGAGQKAAVSAEGELIDAVDLEGMAAVGIGGLPPA
jgi:hypothetical protein